MRIGLAYGRHGLDVNIPDDLDVTVLKPRRLPALPDPERALTDALRNPIASPPLRDLVRPTDRVGIVFSDGTRPAPSHLMIPAIRRELDSLRDEQIVLFNATGSHRPNTERELRDILGDEVVSRYRIVQNDACAPGAHRCVGVTRRGNAVWLNAEFLDCDARILTGFIEPHFFAGFSGGGKALTPGLSRLDTIQRNHCSMNIDEPGATWGVTAGNPLWEDIHEAGAFGNPSFLLNVALNGEKEIVGVFAGDYSMAHQSGCEFVRRTAMVEVDIPFDVAITSNSGYPLDRNLYQSVKGMSAAAQVVRDGGDIIVAAECCDGVPGGSDYGRLLEESGGYERLLAMVRTNGFIRPEMWQAHIQSLIGLRARLHVYSDGLTDEEMARCLVRPCRSIEVALEQIISSRPGPTRICVIPEGPQTIPFLRR